MRMYLFPAIVTSDSPAAGFIAALENASASSPPPEDSFWSLDLHEKMKKARKTKKHVRSGIS